MNKIFNLKKYFLLIFLISIISLLGAVYIEFTLNQKPCKLCVYQRIPYIISIFICFLGFASQKKIIWLSFLTLLFVFSSILAGYHVGIENNIFSEFSGCTNSNINLIDKTDIIESLNNKIPSCKEVNFKIFGLSLATINLFISLLISLYSVKLLINEKNRSN
jgi:disulfide bond formation protein DsbB